MLRKERAEGTAIGVEAESFTSRGLLFPDELALRVVTRWLENRTRFLLDGFPRTAGQARSFDDLLAGRNLPLDIVYFLELSDDEIRSRMLGRLTCTNCGAVFNEAFHRIDLMTPCPQCAGPLARRADDTEAALARRLAQYRGETLPVADHYRRVGILKAIDVTPGRDEVFKTLYDDMKEAA